MSPNAECSTFKTSSDRLTEKTMTRLTTSKRAIRASISVAYGALAGLCAVCADAALTTSIGVALGIAAGMWIKAPVLFRI